MARLNYYALVLGLSWAFLITGCAPGGGLVFNSPVSEAEVEDVFASEEAPAGDTQTADAGPEATANTIDPETFREAMAELRELRRTDPELADEFTAQLETSDPAMFANLVRTWKALLAHKQQQENAQAEFATSDDDFSGFSDGDETSSAFTELTPGETDTQASDPFAEETPYDGGLDFNDAPISDLRPFDHVAARPEQPLDDEPAEQRGKQQGANQAINLAAHSESASTDDFEAYDSAGRQAETWDDPPKPVIDRKSDNSLKRLITEIEQQSGPAGNLPEGVDREVYLRFLYLMAGDREAALEPIPGLTAEEQEFWTNLLWATSNQLDREGIPNESDRAAQTIGQLAQAATRLRTQANLEVANLAFCRRIQSFGSFDRFAQYEFGPNEPVLLYAEVENFFSEATAEGYRTVLKSTIEILDMQGHQVWKQEFDPTEDLCERYRRDYFHSYNFSMPQRIYAGPYVLKLTIEDQLGGKVAEGSIEFEIADK